MKKTKSTKKQKTSTKKNKGIFTKRNILIAAAVVAAVGAGFGVKKFLIV